MLVVAIGPQLSDEVRLFLAPQRTSNDVMDLARFRSLPLLAVLRGVKAEALEPLAETVVECGLQAIEITMNTPEAVRLITRLTRAARDRLMVGAGTVCSVDDFQAAVDAGATFIVSPTLVVDVVTACTEAEIPVFPGALTPREVIEAWSAGATMVKVFPASCFGPTYFRELKGPFPQVELLASGGVTAANLPSFFSCGASAVAFGGNVFRLDWLAEGRFDRIGEAVRELVTAYRAAAGAVIAT